MPEKISLLQICDPANDPLIPFDQRAGYFVRKLYAGILLFRRPALLYNCFIDSNWLHEIAEDLRDVLNRTEKKIYLVGYGQDTSLIEMLNNSVGRNPDFRFSSIQGRLRYSELDQRTIAEYMRRAEYIDKQLKGHIRYVSPPTNPVAVFRRMLAARLDSYLNGLRREDLDDHALVSNLYESIVSVSNRTAAREIVRQSGLSVGRQTHLIVSVIDQAYHAQFIASDDNVVFGNNIRINVLERIGANPKSLLEIFFDGELRAKAGIQIAKQLISTSAPNTGLELASDCYLDTISENIERLGPAINVLKASSLSAANLASLCISRATVPDETRRHS